MKQFGFLPSGLRTDRTGRTPNKKTFGIAMSTQPNLLNFNQKLQNLFERISWSNRRPYGCTHLLNATIATCAGNPNMAAFFPYQQLAALAFLDQPVIKNPREYDQTMAGSARADRRGGTGWSRRQSVQRNACRLATRPHSSTAAPTWLADRLR